MGLLSSLSLIAVAGREALRRERSRLTIVGMIFLAKTGRILAALALLAALTHPALADMRADLAEMKAGQIQTFDSTGHAKAQGLAWQISPPKSWLGEDAPQPLVVQKFTSEQGKGPTSLIIGSSPLPPEAASRAGTLLTVTEVRALIPQGAQNVRLSSTDLNGRAASTTEYTMEETPQRLLQRGQIFYLLVGGHLVVIHGMAVKPPDQTLKAFDAEWELAKTLFHEIGSTFQIAGGK